MIENELHNPLFKSEPLKKVYFMGLRGLLLLCREKLFCSCCLLRRGPCCQDEYGQNNFNP